MTTWNAKQVLSSFQYNRLYPIIKEMELRNSFVIFTRLHINSILNDFEY